MPHNLQFHHNHQQYDDPNHTHNPQFSSSAAGDHHRSAKPIPSHKFLTLILKSIIMLLVISFFFLFLGIVALAVLHLFLLRRPSSPRGREISPERFLPVFNYVGEDGGEDCAVCLEEFREGDMCRKLPACQHVFHAWCVDRWLAKVLNCPICRTRVPMETFDTSLDYGDDETNALWSVGGYVVG